MLRLNNVKKHYQDFELNCSMHVKTGCITGLIGKNSAGKTTTFKLILGLVFPDGGNIEIFGKPVKALGTQEKENIGVVLADSGFSGYLTIKALIPVLANMYHEFEQDAFVQKCREYDLPLDKQLREFSTGMKRKLQILAAVSHKEASSCTKRQTYCWMATPC